LRDATGRLAKEREAANLHAAWTELIPEDEWRIYQRVISAAKARDLRFAVGGAFAVAAATGHWRNTKDIDLYILPQDREAMVEVLTECGLADYYGQLPYDRGWIYRSFDEGVIVDAIWAMPNRRAQVDEEWLTRGLEVNARGERVRAVPPEEIIWGKLYVMQRERCDWTDILNLMAAAGPALDWEHLLRRVGDDARLLGGVLSIFAWLCPGRALELPSWLWGRLQLSEPEAGSFPAIDQQRVRMLDSRPWFIDDLAKERTP